MDEKPLSVRQVAEMLEVNQDTVRRWLRERKLDGKAIGGQAGYRIMPEALRRFMEERHDGAS